MRYLLFHERTKPELPWTLRFEDEKGWQHRGAEKVHFHVPSRTLEEPTANTSQKYYMEAFGIVRWDGLVAHIHDELSPNLACLSQSAHH
jgi:hypothetical protein